DHPLQRLYGVVAPSTAIGSGPTPPLAPARAKVGHYSPPMCTPKPWSEMPIRVVSQVGVVVDWKRVAGRGRPDNVVGLFDDGKEPLMNRTYGERTVVAAIGAVVAAMSSAGLVGCASSPKTQISTDASHDGPTTTLCSGPAAGALIDDMSGSS